jgi:hypothetical protein
MTFIFARAEVHVTAVALVFMAGLFSGALSLVQSLMLISIGLIPALLALTLTRTPVAPLTPQEAGRQR